VSAVYNTDYRVTVGCL